MPRVFLLVYLICFMALAKAIERNRDGNTFFRGLKNSEQSGLARLEFVLEVIRDLGFGEATDFSTAQIFDTADFFTIDEQAELAGQQDPERCDNK